MENYHTSGMRTENIPILTDEFSPVEIMINPVTSQPYFNEYSVFSQDELRMAVSESTIVKLILLIAVAFTWLTVFQGIWKKSYSKTI